MNIEKQNKLFEIIEIIGVFIILISIALFIKEKNYIPLWQENPKKLKARQDCDTLARSIQKFNSLEGRSCIFISDLKGKYIGGIDTLKDPWGNLYIMDAHKGIVYSIGPNGIDDLKISGLPFDEIVVSYINTCSPTVTKTKFNP